MAERGTFFPQIPRYLFVLAKQLQFKMAYQPDCEINENGESMIFMLNKLTVDFDSFSLFIHCNFTLRIEILNYFGTRITIENGLFYCIKKSL